MLPILELYWPELVSLLIIFMVLFGLIMEIYSVFTKANPHLWWGVGVIAGISLILTGMIWTWADIFIDYLSAFLTGVYELQGYLFLAGIGFLLFMIFVDMIYSWSRDWFIDSGVNDYTTSWNLFLSFGAVLLVVTLLITPGILSEHLEKIETSQSGLISTEELISDSNSTVSYSPYLQMSMSNRCQFQDIYFDGYGFFWYVDSARHDSSSILYDIDGHTDMAMLDQSGTGTDYLYVVWNVSASDLLSDGINYVSLTIDCNINYSIHQLDWMGQDTSYNTFSGSEPLSSESWYNSWKGITASGKTVYRDNLTTSDLTTGSTMQSSWDIDNVFLQIRFPNGYSANTPVFIDWQFHPNYYEETTTTWDNETVTHYEPFIQTYSNPYTVGMWTFGIGGFLLMILSPCILPWIRIIPWLRRGLGL